MDCKCRHHEGGGGFLLGVLVAVILTLLFSTKKGRGIIQKVLDTGLSNFADISSIFDDEDLEELENEEVEPSKKSQKKKSNPIVEDKKILAEEIKDVVDGKVEEVKEEVTEAVLDAVEKTENVIDRVRDKEASGIRRFFKGTKR